MAAVVVVLDVVQVDGLGDARHLVEFARVVPQVGIVAESPQVALEVAVVDRRSEEHTSELQSLMRISYAVFCLKKIQKSHTTTHNIDSLIQRKQTIMTPSLQTTIRTN